MSPALAVVLLIVGIIAIRFVISAVVNVSVDKTVDAATKRFSQGRRNVTVTTALAPDRQAALLRTAPTFTARVQADGTLVFTDATGGSLVRTGAGAVRINASTSDAARAVAGHVVAALRIEDATAFAKV